MAVYNRTGEASNGMAILPAINRRNMEHVKLCAICQHEYKPRYPAEMFCNACYHSWYNEIRERQPWIKFCISSEIKRRRQEIKLQNFLFLGNKWDVDDKGNLVTRDGYNG